MKSKAAVHPAEAELRAIALAYPESLEDFPWGESAFKVKGKVFLFMSVSVDGIKLSVKLPTSHERALASSFAEPTGYGLGKSGWVTSMFASDERVPIGTFKEWIDESFRAVAPKKLVALLSGVNPTPPAVANKSVANKSVAKKAGTKKAVVKKPVAKKAPAQRRTTRKSR